MFLQTPCKERAQIVGGFHGPQLKSHHLKKSSLSTFEFAISEGMPASSSSASMAPLAKGAKVVQDPRWVP